MFIKLFKSVTILVNKLIKQIYFMYLLGWLAEASRFGHWMFSVPWSTCEEISTHLTDAIEQMDFETLSDVQFTSYNLTIL